MNDSDLVRRLRERDPAAFQCLSEHYLPSVWRFVYTRVDGDSHLAEDLVSETVLALLRALSGDSTDTIGNPGGWLRAVAHHKVQDHYRAVARVRHLIDDAKQQPEQDQQDDPACMQETREKRAEVRRAMDSLSEQHRTALEWKYLDKLPVREIAVRWEMTEKAAESILFRARREFRKKIMLTDVVSDDSEQRSEQHSEQRGAASPTPEPNTNTRWQELEDDGLKKSQTR